jgi:hypothetical protein
MRVLFITALLLAGQAFAATFTVEDEDLVPVPRAVASTVQNVAKADFADPAGKPCRFVGKAVTLENNKGAATDWIVTTADACSWAASAAPVWVVRNTGGKYEVVLSHITYDLTLGSAVHNGLRNVATARATAARREEQLWVFDGNRYVVSRNTVR